MVDLQLPPEDRKLQPLTDSTGRIGEWVCSACSWRIASNNTMDKHDLRRVFHSFDLHRCEHWLEQKQETRMTEAEETVFSEQPRRSAIINGIRPPPVAREDNRC